MLDNILKFFDQHFIDSAPDFDQFDEHDLQLATIALLIEMMHIDDECTADERSAILRVVCEKFSISEDQANELINKAEDHHQQSTDYFQFTRLINKGFTPEQKVKLVEYLWTVAFADGVLDHHEEHMLRKIAELLHVSHHDFLKTKFKVKDNH
jgi:uncharacterized tellurite resistance protein B-like protein